MQSTTRKSKENHEELKPFHVKFHPDTAGENYNVMQSTTWKPWGNDEELKPFHQQAPEILEKTTM